MSMIPRTSEDFTQAWMNEVLALHLNGASVTDCQARQSDSPGQTAEVIMIELEYSDSSVSLPQKMVAKITSQDPLILTQLIASFDQYRRETSFYSEFPDIGIPVPQCLHQNYHQATEEFVILMGDLAPATSPSWAITPAEVELSLSALPAFHAKWWNDPMLREKDWMVQFDDRNFFGLAFGAAKAGADKLDDYYENPEPTQALMSYAQENLEQLLAWTASRPFTFVHGDYHAKQMCFPTPAGGDFSVIDWQFPFVAQGAWDFARMTGMCLDTKERQGRERILLDQYLQGLAEHGVNNYNLNDLENDYRFGLFISQMIMSIAHGDTDVEIFKKECGKLNVNWQEAMLYRTQKAMLEWDLLDFMQQL